MNQLVLADRAANSIGCQYTCVGQGLPRQCVAGSCSIIINANDPGSTGPRPLPPAGAGPNFAEATNTRWLLGSSPMLRDPCGVCMFSMT